jgi:hypothetical protein
MATGEMQPALDTFNKELDRASSLVADIQKLRRPPPATARHPGLPELQLHLVRELAFLRCLLAWETFLEDSFLVYLTGGEGLSGKRANALVTAKTVPQARAVLLGDQDFLSWSGSAACDRARVWFSDGEPYVRAFGAFPTNKEMWTVRNRIAHNSGKAQETFNKLRREAFPNAKDRHGMGPGAFLARPFGRHSSRFAAYVLDLRAAATTIAQN